MTFSGVDSIVLLVGMALLGASIATAVILLRRATETKQKETQAIGAAAQLEEWRRIGTLVMSNEDFHTALKIEEQNPGQLGHLTKIIQRIIAEEEHSPEHPLRLLVRVEYEEKAVNTPATKPPKGHLELVAEFA